MEDDGGEAYLDALFEAVFMEVLAEADARGAGAGIGVPADGPDPPGGAPPLPAPGTEGRGGGTGGPDSPEVVGQGVDDFRPDPTGFTGAVSLLEDVHDRRPIKVLHVRDARGVARLEEARSFPRFVALLGRREGGARAVRLICLDVDWRLLPRDVVTTLFRDVLPAHPTLTSIAMDIRTLPARCLKLLATALPTDDKASTVSRLGFTCGTGGGLTDQENLQENVQAIVDMLKRNVVLEVLGVHFHLDANQCKLICQALPRNKNLVALSLNVPDMDAADTLDGVAKSSSLQQLEVRGSFSDGSLRSLEKQLRTNETLLRLQLDDTGHGRRDPQALLELAKTYNCTLRTIEGNLGSGHGDLRVGERFEHFRARNAHIRAALKALQDPDSRFVVSTPLLPRMLGLVSDLPTVLRRILRMGYVNAVSELLVAEKGTASAATSTTEQMTASTTIITATTVEASEPGRGGSSRLTKRRRI